METHLATSQEILMSFTPGKPSGRARRVPAP